MAARSVRWRRGRSRSRQLATGAVTVFAGEYVEISDPSEPNDSLDEATFVVGPLQNPQTAGSIVIEIETAFLDLADEDFYSFTAFDGVPIAARVEPRAAGRATRDVVHGSGPWGARSHTT